MANSKSSMNENLIRLLIGGAFSLMTFLVVSYFNGFITHAEFNEAYKPETLVKKEKYNADKIEQTQQIASLQTDMSTVKGDVKELKKDIKEILKYVRQ